MRLKDIVNVRNVKTDRTDLPYIALENIVSWEGTFVPTEIQTEGTNARYYAGDVLFGKLRPYLAKAYIPDNDGICSTEFLVLKTKKELNNKFLEYYLLSPDFIGYIKNQVAGVKMPRTNWTEIGNLEVGFPGREKQDEIVAFLDEHIASINKRIELREQERNTLVQLKHSEIYSVISRGLDSSVHLKESGIDWLGQIPEHWSLMRGKDVLRILNGYPFDSALFTNEECYPQLIRIRDIDNGETEIRYSGWYPKTHIIKDGDVLVGMDGDFNICKWKGGFALLNQRVCKIEGNRGIDTDYMFYCLRFPLKRLNDITNSTTVKHLSSYDIQHFILPVPPYQEQKAIVESIDNKLDNISKRIINVESQIERLKNLKRSLINEVITGKRTI